MERQIEHGGLSVAIATAANKLKNKFNIISSDCIPLRRHKSKFIPTEAEVFLLICSIFPDDSRIPVEDLAMIGMGLKLFEDVHNMFAAKCRVHELISKINEVNGEKIRLYHEEYGLQNEYVSMLIGARDLARSLASSYPLIFHGETVIEKWPQSNLYKDCYGLSLVLNKIREHPVNMECPKLSLLLLKYRDNSQSMLVDFFEGMEGLRVLSLDVSSLPQSLSVLKNLTTLCLKLPKFENMSWIGSLILLEFLSVSTLSLTDIPDEMGELQNLRLLDLRKTNLAYIPVGVFSRMLKLEELYLPLNFRRWGCKAIEEHDDYDEWGSRKEDNYDEEEGINAVISEIVSLPLHALQISIPKASSLPIDSQIFKNIRRFKVVVRNHLIHQPFCEDSMNAVQLMDDSCYIKGTGICDLLNRTEYLSLTRVRYLKNGIFQLEDGGFPCLKRMIISECDELECLVDTTRFISPKGNCFFPKLDTLHLSMLPNLNEICHGRSNGVRWFPNLSQISIRFCHKLKYVFPLSIVKGLKLLKTIEILDCSEMEEIFHLDEESDDSYFIEKLDLHSLPKLIGLLVQKDNTVNGVDVDTNQSLIANENKDVIGYVDMFGALIPLKLTCRWLQNLKTLRIAFCVAVKIIFLFEENHATSRAFNSLKELELIGLRNLVHIWFQIPPKIIAFQNLQVLTLLECNNLYLFSSRVAKLLVQLQKVFISRCDMMEEIVVNADGKEIKDKIVFPQLKVLELQRMSTLRVFYGGLSNIELPLLETVKFNQCNKMKSFSYGQLRTPFLERVQINGSLCSLIGDLNETMKRFVANRNGQVFVFSDLKIATHNFSTLLSGEGFFGNSYLGWIDAKTFLPSQAGTGVAVSVKKLKWESPQRLREWELDVDFLERKLHPNVVKLFGHCWNDKELLLVYEFMQGGSLDNHLFTSDPLIETLSWDVRLKIAIGAARGFDFLHTSGPEVIHRNIKSSNILLDGSYNAKISGFEFRGFEFLSNADSHMSNRAVGTLGYVDPAYVKTGHLHVKSDLYSFGVVLLELMTGLRVLDENRPDGQQNLVDWLKPILLESKKLKNIMDTRMEGEYSSEAILLTAELALKCTGSNPMNRPSMKEVVDALEQIQALKGKEDKM